METLDQVVKSSSLVKKVDDLPHIEFAVQNTPEHIKIKNMAELAGIRLPLIDPHAFMKSFYHKQSGLMLPVFGFFSVDQAPEIITKIEVRRARVTESYRYNNEPNPGFVSKGLVEDFARSNAIKAQLVTLAVITGVAALIVGAIWYFLRPHLNTTFTADGGIAVCSVLTAVVGMIWFGLMGSALDHDGFLKLENFNLSIMAKLRHIVPAHIINKIQMFKPKFNGGVFIVADISSQYEVKMEHLPAPKSVRLPDPDPLIVGVHKIHGENHFFLIDKFDMNDAESYITKEFLLT